MTSAVADAPSNTTAENTKPRRYLILGCGPAGLIAYRTLEQHGVKPDNIVIMSDKPEPSVIGGAQFLHSPIFGEEEPDALVSVVKIGTSLGYANKVYGNPATATSFDKFGTEIAEEIKAWSLWNAYEKLWMLYGSGIVNRRVDAEALMEVMDTGEYDEIISTIPPTAYCSNPDHSFKSVPIIIGEPMDCLPMDDCIVYSGREQDRWYRTSNLFGENGAEFGTSGEPTISPALEDKVLGHTWESRRELKKGLKPLGTDCDCGYGHPTTKLLRVGRFGMWDRKRLLHQVPSQVAAIL